MNKTKCEYTNEAFHFSFVLSEKGSSPDPTKLKSIEKALQLTTTHAIRGMATYCAKFIPNISDISEPLWKLTRKG